jgi:cyclic pyranopterin phosphate synthase
MPEEEYVWLPREDLLTFEEIRSLVDIFSEVGIEKIRLTGGEPLLRRDLPALIHLLAEAPRIHDLAMTTNGVLLVEQAQALYDAGLHRITVSLDTLRPERFRAMTRRDSLAKVRSGIQAVHDVGFQGLKLDTVVMRGQNDDELVDLIEYGKRFDAEVRFIEYMDVGGATRWSWDTVISRAQILEQLERHYGPIYPVVEVSSAPAERFQLPDGTVFGIIASTTTPFCRSCDRSRLTADGMWYLCLYAQKGTDLRTLWRKGASKEEMTSLIVGTWRNRRDRGAEERHALGHRDTLIPLEGLKRDPHLEMHTRGG